MMLGASSAKSILAATEFLAGRELFGLVWFNEQLRVTSRIGPLAEFVTTGLPVTETVDALFGQEGDIHALRSTPAGHLLIPNVAVVAAGEDRLRLDIHVYWLADRKEYLLLLARAPAHHTLEMQLYEENRRRRLAEETIVAQAEELQRTNGELTRANRDLSEFAYIISHDLNAPLRGLRYHCEDLQSALGASPDPLVARQLKLIEFQSRRMSAMLADLLAYARIGRKEEAVCAVDTRDLVATIVQSLPRPASFALAISGSWPVVWTHAAPLDLVLRNLVHNAIVHHDREDGRVEVACSPCDSGVELTIADDGPGIDPRYHEAVFQPFCKLAPASDEAESTDRDSDGSGIGLALVRRTAEIIGASIVLDSDPGRRRGTLFRVHWPIEASRIPSQADI